MLQTINTITMLQNKYRAVLKKMHMKSGALLVSLCLCAAPFVFTQSIEAADFGENVTLPANALPGWESDNHKLNDNGTTIKVDTIYQLHGVISGSGSLTKSGTGTLRLYNRNAYTGATIVREGTLMLAATDAIAASSDVEIRGDIFLEADQTLNNISGGGYISSLGGILPTATLTANNSKNTTFSGVIIGNGNLIKDGASSLTLSGVNEYTGETTVIGGSLILAATDAIAASSSVRISNVNGSAQIVLEADQTLNNIYSDGSINLNAHNLTANNSENTRFIGVITGTGSLTKTGAGTLSLNQNTYTDATIVREGILDLAATDAIASSSEVNIKSGAQIVSWGYSQTLHNISGDGTIILSGGTLTDNNNKDTTFGGVIRGANLTKDGAGTLILSGANNNYTGMTTVRGGTLELLSDLTASSGLTLHSGTTFKTNGSNHSLSGKELTVWGKAAYDGNLTADGATMNFITPGLTNDTMLTVTGSADITSSKVNLGVSGGISLSDGTKLSLIKADGGINGTAAQGDGQGIIRVGATVVHDITLQTTANELIAEVGQGNAYEQSKSLSEGRLAGLSILREGQELLTEQGIGNALSMAKKEDGAAVFAASGYNKSRYNTGSHIDNHGWSILAGLAKGQTLNNGRLTWGGFIEGGRGSYSSFNSFVTGNVSGSGKTDYMGIGGFIHHDSAGNEKGCHYSEGSVRIGQAKSDFAALLSGVDAGYTARSMYLGAHYGYGYIKKLNKEATLDMYGKLLYTRQNGDNVTTASGDDVSFDAVDSLRLRIGTEYKRPVNAMTSVSYGLAYEYELAGKQKAATSGYNIDAPSLKGGSVLASIGLNYKARPDSNFSLGLNVIGYAGKREGVSFNAQVQWMF